MKLRHSSIFAASSLKMCFGSNARSTAAAFATVLSFTAAAPLQALTVTWDGGPSATGTDIGVAANWTGDVLPNVATPDTAQWDGTVAGALSLVYSDTSLGGLAGNGGVNLSLTAGQTSSFNLDSGANINALRMNGISIAAGAGAFSLGNSANTFNLTLGGAAGTHTWTNDSANAATIASDVAFGLGGGGNHIIAVGGAGNWNFNNVIAGAIAIAKSGVGTTTLSGASTYTGGTSISAGTLNINHASGIGSTATGGLTITGGVINNTSAAAITTSAAKAQAWNGDFTFTGTKDLNFNGGAVTLGGTAGSRSITVTAGKMSTGIITGAAGFGLTKAGAGTLTLATNALNTSNIAGDLNITGGVVQANGDITVGGLTGSGTLENGGAATKWYTVNNAVDNTFSGTIQNGPTANVRVGLLKKGVGTLNLTGTANIPEDRLSIENGAIRITGTYTMGYGTAANQMALVGSIANQNGVLNIDGGIFNANKGYLAAAPPSMGVGTVASSRGFVKMTSGSLSTVGEFHLGRGAGAYAAMSMSGGTLTSGSWLVVGLNNDRAVLNQSGGNIVVSVGAMTTGAGGNGSIGVVNLSGGNFTSNGGVLVAENGVAAMTVSGTAAVSTGFLQFAGNATSLAGSVNLLGGSILTGSVTKGTSTATGVYLMNFNGGTLKPKASNATFFDNLANTSAYVYGGGAAIDTNTFDVTIAQPLLAPTGSGVNGIASFTGGAGYIDTPVVTVVRGSLDTTGVGATAVANVAGGVVTGITITNPGVGYTDTPTFTVFGGGATTVATITGTAPTANSVGGLTKSNTGTLALTGASSYTGATAVNGGSLRLSGSGSVNASSGITVNGNGAKLVQTSSTAVTAPVTLTNGTLDGTGSLTSVVIADSVSNVVKNGNGTSGAQLTVDSLTFADAATVTLDVNSPSAAIVANTLTTGPTLGAGKVTVNATNVSWLPGTYDLISYTTLAGGGYSEFVKGTISGLSGRQSATLSNTGTAVALNIAGDNPRWNGSFSNDWTTAAIGGSKNWELITSSAPTDFINGDIVLFDDLATSSTVNIANSNISPLSTTFSNTSLPYSLSSAGGFGIASGTVTVNGGGVVSINNANTYSGGTFLTVGTLDINNASAIGTGTLTIAASTVLDNTSVGPVTLTTANPQNWNGNFTFTGTQALNLGTGAVTLSANRTVTTTAGTLTVGGAIGGTGFSLTKVGAGTLALAGTNTYTGITTVKEGTLAITSGTTGTAAANLEISPDLSGSGTVNVSGGTLNTLRTIIGGNTANNGSPSPGTLLQSGGVINTAQWFTVGSGNIAATSSANGVFTMTGGVLNTSTVGTENMEVANFADATGVVTMSGSSAINLCNNASIAMGANNGAGNGTINQNGGAVTFYTNVATTVGGTGALRLGAAATIAATSTYTYALNGGVLTVPSITRNAAVTNLSSGIFNFNGGTLKPTAANATFLQGLTAANVLSGGALIDDTGFALTIGQNLVSGVAGDGGLSKAGSGTLTLTGTNSYVGPTNVNAGTLVLSGTGAVNGSSGISINGSGAKLLQTSSVGVSSPINIVNGTLDGVGSVAAVSVASGAGNVLTHGNGGTGVLSTSSLTFNDAATVNVKVTSTAPAITTGTLTTGAANGAGQVTVNASNTSWTNGQTYNLISYSSLGGIGFPEFLKGTITGLTVRQSATLTNPSGNIALAIAGDNPVWSGGFDGEWSTATISAPKNWNLQTGGTPTDFLTTDNVLFDDTAAGTSAVSIAAAGVSPTSTTFNNTTKNYTFTSAGSLGIASGILTKGGTGAVTLSNVNTYAGGTTVNSGTLNINNASAIGTGPLTLTGGAIGNTSTAAITLTTNNAQNWNGDFSYTGPDSLNLGTGAATLGGSGTVRSVTVTAGTLTVDSIPVATGFGLTKAGAGTLAMNGSLASNLGGTLNVIGGAFQIGSQDFTATGLTGNAIVEDGGAINRWLRINNTTDTTFTGILQNGSGAGNLGLVKSGNGTLTLTGANTYNDTTTVAAGKLVFSGTTNNTREANVVANTAASNAVLVISPGATFGSNFNAGQIYNSSMTVSTNATSAGSVQIGAAGGTLTVNRQIAVGPTGYGSLSQAGGSTTIGGFLALGGSASGGVVNQSGGVITLSTAPATIGYIGTAGTAVVNLSGAAQFNANGAAGNGVWVGELGTGVLNVSGSALLSIPNDGVILGKANTTLSSGTVNLRGGTVLVKSISKGTGTGNFNFNGGTLKANTANATFMQGLTSAYVHNGGAKIDTNGVAITIAQPLLVPAGSGVSASGLATSGGGYIDTPLVQITGTGTGAAAVANIDGAGNLTGITMTNPGTGYTAPPTFTLVGGGIGNTGAIGGSASLVTNVGGGLTKSGLGTLTLTGANTYTGDTVVTAGTLSLSTNYLADAADVRLTTGAVLDLTFAVGTPDTIDELYIDGVQQATGVWGAVGSGAAHECALITGTGRLNVTTGSAADAYTTWATAKGLTVGVNDGKEQDPDGDGQNNLGEFAFDSDPLSGAASGKVVGKVATVGGNPVLTLTLPVRTGATFSGATEQVSALVDTLVYRVQGSDDLATFGLVISEVTGGDATTIQTGMPSLSTGWTYRTFRTPGTVVDGDPQDFIRAKVNN